MDDSKEFDVLIFGGGPAGISAGIWADELGLSSAIVDRGSTVGGQLFNVYNPIKNFPGAEFENGAAMAHALAKQISKRSTKLMLGREVVAVDVAARKLIFADGESLTGKNLILATGVRRRKLNIPGEDEFCGKGILDSGAKNPSAVAGKTVAIIGGGDAALENALILSKHAKRILLIHRRSEFSARPEFVSRMRDAKNIELILESKAVGFSGDEHLKTVEIANNLTKQTHLLTIDHALIRIGFQPNSELFLDPLESDELGYIRVDQNRLTTVDNVYAVGDLSRHNSQSVSAAVGDGTSAIMNIVP